MDEAARTAHYSREEITSLAWGSPPPDFAILKIQWREALRDGRSSIQLLPPQHMGKAVLKRSGSPFQGDAPQLADALQNDELLFHEGHIGGVWPSVAEKR